VPAVVVGAALAAIAVLFVFFRPEFHPKGEDSLLKVDMSRYPAASDGWTWARGQPGFRFGEHEEEWNLSEVQAAELAPARAAARPWGVAPASVRLVDAIRLGPDDLSLIVAGTDASDHPCLGFVMPNEPVEFFCSGRLADISAFLLVLRPSAYDGDALFLEGIPNGDVTKVVVDAPPEWPNATVFDRRAGGGSYWGTFGVSLANAHAMDVTVSRENAAPIHVRIAAALPGDRVIPIPG
jgi:hypothetical protein